MIAALPSGRRHDVGPRVQQVAAVVEQLYPYPATGRHAQFPGAALACRGQAEGQGVFLQQKDVVVTGSESHGALHVVIVSTRRSADRSASFLWDVVQGV